MNMPMTEFERMCISESVKYGKTTYKRSVALSSDQIIGRTFKQLKASVRTVAPDLTDVRIISVEITGYNHGGNKPTLDVHYDVMPIINKYGAAALIQPKVTV